MSDIHPPFVAEVDLTLEMHDSGYGYDAWVVSDERGGRLDLAYLVAMHFRGLGEGVPSGDWPIGRVRITIERLASGRA